MKQSNNAKIIVNDVTKKLIKLMETAKNDGGEWLKPHKSNAYSLYQVSSNGHVYRGFNIINLWCEQMDKQYSSNVWGSYKEWKGHNCYVKKGQKATLVIYYKTLQFEGKGLKENGDPETYTVPFMRCWPVFNLNQVQGENSQWEAKKEKKEPDTKVVPKEKADSLVKNTKVKIKNIDDNRAYYHTKQDYINMPRVENFYDTKGYYGTLFHELTHSTGHESRLNRKMEGKFGSPSYAFEELVAELGASFLCGLQGLEKAPRIDHARYLNSWIKALKEQEGAILKASGFASKAVDWIQEQSKGVK